MADAEEAYLLVLACVGVSVGVPTCVVRLCAPVRAICVRSEVFARGLFWDSLYTMTQQKSQAIKLCFQGYLGSSSCLGAWLLDVSSLSSAVQEGMTSWSNEASRKVNQSDTASGQGSHQATQRKNKTGYDQAAEENKVISQVMGSSVGKRPLETTPPRN